MIFKSDAFHFFIGHCWTLNHFEPSSGLGPCYWRGRVCCEITMFKYLTTWQSMKTSLTKKHSVLSEVQYCHIHSPLIHFSPIVLKIMTPDPLSFFSSHTQPALLSGTVEHMASSFPTAAKANHLCNRSMNSLRCLTSLLLLHQLPLKRNPFLKFPRHTPTPYLWGCLDTYSCKDTYLTLPLPRVDYVPVLCAPKGLPLSGNLPHLIIIGASLVA